MPADPPGAPDGGVDWDAVFSSDTEDEASALAKATARVAEAGRLKEEGSALLRAGGVQEACAAYRRALSHVWALYRCPRGAAAPAAAAAVGAAIDLNLALCHIKLEEWDAARRCATRALAVEPENAKGLYRRGLASLRLGLLDAAEEDLAAASRIEPSAVEVRQRLEEARSLQVAAKGADVARQGGVARGFLCGAEAPGAADGGEGAGSEVPVEGEWVFASQVREALDEVVDYLSAISRRRVVCDSDEELRGLREQLDAATELLPQVRGVLEAAVVEPPQDPAPSLDGATFELAELLERMAAGLEAFRPAIAALERRAGELDALRVCRAPAAEGAARGHDVELVRWGDAGPAAPGDFAAALFPPTGRPPDAAAAAWQREVFHRVFQNGASAFAAGAARLVLRELLRRGARLRFRGRAVEDVGLASGSFFREALAEGPATPGEASEAGRADAMALWTSKEGRAMLLQSFTSLGEAHAWLLLRLRADDGDSAAEAAADLCAGALGLLPRAGLVRCWDLGPGAGDERFVARRVSWSDEAPPSPQLRAALGAVLSRAELPMGPEDVPARAADAPAGAAEEEDAVARREVGLRLRQAAARLALPCPLDAPGPGGAAPFDAELEAARAAAAAALARRKLEAAGLSKVAAKLGL